MNLKFTILLVLTVFVQVFGQYNPIFEYTYTSSATQSDVKKVLMDAESNSYSFVTLPNQALGRIVKRNLEGQIIWESTEMYSEIGNYNVFDLHNGYLYFPNGVYISQQNSTPFSLLKANVTNGAIDTVFTVPTIFGQTYQVYQIEVTNEGVYFGGSSYGSWMSFLDFNGNVVWNKHNLFYYNIPNAQAYFHLQKFEIIGDRVVTLSQPNNSPQEAKGNILVLDKLSGNILYSFDNSREGYVPQDFAINGETLFFTSTYDIAYTGHIVPLNPVI